ncbi:phage head closure protein [Bacillus sp. FJAT-28004]|uniref:phage head closure protein n=1 Tax=Bacillus sp. FJAT-28004 TaxID=1679165 RepID=UPI0006B671E2|nr:phage head closure protein [Bacillus sp. FJAT-28004]
MTQRFDRVVYLIRTTTTENAIGDPIKTVSRRETFAEENSVRQSEHYQAAANGLKLELTFVVWTAEYQDEPQLEYEGTVYVISRTFKRKDERTELVCSGLVNEVV